jgi:hypothetical protein
MLPVQDPSGTCYAESGSSRLMVSKESLKQTLRHAFVVAAVAVALCWPAFLNGFPLFFPDSVEYLGKGSYILGKLQGMPLPEVVYISHRSEIFSVSLLYLHRTAWLWPIVAFQAVATAWILWLVVRALRLRSPMVAYAIASTSVILIGGAAWYVSYIMPDCLGALLYLSLFLLVFCPSALRHWETVVLIVFSAWAAAAHASFLAIGTALCLVFALLWLVRRPEMRLRGSRIGLVFGILAVSVLAQMMVHRRLYGHASLFGKAPPFLMARLLGDGPARRYLQLHCAGSSWYLCTKVGELPATEDDFLWTADSIWQTATPEQQDELHKEEMPLLLDTLRAYPLQQAKRSMENFGNAMVMLGPVDFLDYPVLRHDPLEWAAPGLSARYPSTRQARHTLPLAFFRRLQLPVTVLAALVVLLFLPSLWKEQQYLMLYLAAVVVFIVGANAFLSGVASTLSARYQGRVSWLLVFMAGLILYDAWLTFGIRRERVA